MQGPYESQAAWVRDVVQWVGSRDDVELDYQGPSQFGRQ